MMMSVGWGGGGCGGVVRGGFCIDLIDGGFIKILKGCWVVVSVDYFY